RDIGSEGARVDVHSRVTRPVSVFGFFTVSPFVGGRVTAYDKTVTGVRTGLDGVTVEMVNNDPRVRTLVETGADFEARAARVYDIRSEEHTSELQSRGHLVCRLLLEKKKKEQNKKDREVQTGC